MRVRPYSTTATISHPEESSGHRIDLAFNAVQFERMENCSEFKLNEIVSVVRAILNEEMNRRGVIPGLNIFQDGSRVAYAHSYDKVSFNEFGPVKTYHYLQFETEDLASLFLSVINGILMLGLTKFKMTNESFISDIAATPDPTPTIDIEVVPASSSWFMQAV